MVSPFVKLRSFGMAVLAGSATYLTYRLSRRWEGHDPVVEREIMRERLRAYRVILAAMVSLNREAVDLGDMQFQEEADLMAYGQESKLSEKYGDVAEAYESNFHVISPAVRDAVSDYVDYLSTYHDNGAQVGQLLSLTGTVAEAMRSDLELETLFPQSAETSQESGTDDADQQSAEDDSIPGNATGSEP